jgi:hypothetical protein
MSFSLGGDGTFLPPRKSTPKPSLPPGTTPVPQDALPSIGVSARGESRQAVQVSEPAFTEPAVRVASDGQTARLPIDTPKNVVEIGNRKRFRNVQEVAQSAIAKSGGTVVPLENIRDSGTRAATPSARAVAPTAASPEARLCQLVFVTQAAKFGHSLEVAGKAYSVEQVRAAAPKIVAMLEKGVRDGKISVDQIKACVDAYCKQASCVPPSQTGTSNVVDQPAAASVNAPAASALAPVAAPPLISLVKPTPEVAVIEEVPAAPAKKSNALWWILALAGGALLLKKLAGVKVIGAAMAGAPLIAELESEDDDEDEEEDAHEEPESHGPPEAHASKE